MPLIIRAALWLCAAILLILMVKLSLLVWTFPDERQEAGAMGLERTECWFNKSPVQLLTRCYYVHVPENHHVEDSNIISFPLIVFRSFWGNGSKSPVLHLGGGGPGGPLYLDDANGVAYLKDYHNDFSLKVGRDLYVMDPRGVGLARPSLNCGRFVDSQLLRFQQNLSLAESLDGQQADYRNCIVEMRQQSIDLAQYNSLSVAEDVELLRRSMGTESWVLFGVSYGAVYAQTIARRAPASVESMVLDSAAFPHIPEHRNFYDATMATYQALYSHCDISPACDLTATEAQQRLWTTYAELESRPLEVDISFDAGGSFVDLLLTGNRLIEVLLNASYSTEIFLDLHRVLEALESGDTRPLQPYIEDYVYFMLDRQWGDISYLSHYCHEMKPFADHKALLRGIETLPEGYIRESTMLAYLADDFCIEMGVPATDPVFAKEQIVTVPTLFLHGEKDTITPLTDVIESSQYFLNHKIKVFPAAHSVITAEECAEIAAARFVEDHSAHDLGCYPP